ncbi:MAG: nitrilase-related carbon-nitrogen hydrolase, partial [Halobacteria archaeon]|nr:nitrilase-related carbon-nitrogen hydrolase [Halobacteria archaeon]
PHVKLGLSICSELWVPELQRILALRGAEMIFAPVHGLHSDTLFDPNKVKDTWRSIARARAAENTCYVIVTQNAYKRIDTDFKNISGALVASPEEIVGLREEPGVLVTEIDMDRLDYLRTRNYDEENLSRHPETDRKRGILHYILTW